MILNNLGNWNPATNTPTLADGTGNTGDCYVVEPYGATVDFGSGDIKFAASNIVVYNGSRWQRISNRRPFNSIITEDQPESQIFTVDGGYYDLTFRSDSVFDGATIQMHTATPSSIDGEVIFTPVVQAGSETVQTYSVPQTGVALQYLSAGTLVKFVAMGADTLTNIIIELC